MCWRYRSGKADVQLEVSEPQVKNPAAGPMHDKREKDDDQNYDHQPEEEHNDSGNRVPGYGSRSSHGLQLPGAVRFILGRKATTSSRPRSPAGRGRRLKPFSGNIADGITFRR
jgi:hypothetical protein